MIMIDDLPKISQRLGKGLKKEDNGYLASTS